MQGRVGAGLLLCLLGASFSGLRPENPREARPDPRRGACRAARRIEKPANPYIQELDSDAAALGKIPPDPLFATDPLRPILKPIDVTAEQFVPSNRMAFSATYTFLNQYATITPDGVRHNQTSGRLDFSGTYVAYD